MDLKRSVIAVHRWLGVALCLLFFLWFMSGVGMMYWDFPAVSAADRLEHSPRLKLSSNGLSAIDAYTVLHAAKPPTSVRLNTFDGRPVYRIRSGGVESIVDADSGEVRRDIARETVDRIAATWTGLPVSAARVVSMTAPDQWTVQGALRTVRPLWKYSWPNGDQVYVAQPTGEVVQFTTTASRIGAWLGPIPHWLYFTPLRVRQQAWNRVVIWASGIGTIASILGIVVGVWMFSPSKRYRRAGAPAAFPYRGQKRWHATFGLIFGVAATTWVYSGMLSMDPFGERPRVAPLRLLAAVPELTAFAMKQPREALEQLGDRDVRELELASFAGAPVYIATLAGGDTRVIPMDGLPRPAFDVQQIADAVRTATAAHGGADIDVIDQYDRYYLDRRRSRPLPVVVAKLHDADATRYYIDPKTARVVGSYAASGWTNRWLYHGLHSLDFPWLYNYRPAWDIVVIALLAGGAALSVTSIVLAWRVIRGTQG